MKNKKPLYIIVACCLIFLAVLVILLPKVLFNSSWIKGKLLSHIEENYNGTGTIEEVDWDFWSGFVSVSGVDLEGKSERTDWEIELENAIIRLNIRKAIFGEFDFQEISLAHPSLTLVEHTPPPEPEDEGEFELPDFNNSLETEHLRISQGTLSYTNTYNEKPIELTVEDFLFDDHQVSILNPVSLIWGSKVSGEFYLGDRKEAIQGTLLREPGSELRIKNIDVAYITQALGSRSPITLKNGIASYEIYPYIPEEDLEALEESEDISFDAVVEATRNLEVIAQITLEDLEPSSKKDQVVIDSLKKLSMETEDEKTIIIEKRFDRGTVVVFGIGYLFTAMTYRLYPEKISEGIKTLQEKYTESKEGWLGTTMDYFNSEEKKEETVNEDSEE